MIKKDITYTDFDGNEQTETHYFHFSESELVELLVADEGIIERLETMVKTRDGKSIMRETKRFILDSYGIRSDDGKRFIKNGQLSEEFAQSGAYNALFIELATDADASAAFMNTLMPADLLKKFQNQPQDKPIIARPLMPAEPLTIVPAVNEYVANLSADELRAELAKRTL